MIHSIRTNQHESNQRKRERVVLKKLRLCTARITNNTNIYVPSKADAFMSRFVNPTHKHKKDCSLNILMTKNSWSYTFNKLGEEIWSVPHSLNFIQFLRLLNQPVKYTVLIIFSRILQKFDREHHVCVHRTCVKEK